MNTTRTGKIARLPKSIRDELNQLLVDGLPAAQILEWLSEEEAVKDVLFKYFNCRPITDKNLSEWRHGGHQEWLREQQTLAFAANLVERSGNLTDQSGHQRLPDHFANLLATGFIQLAQTMLDEQPDTKKRWDTFCEIHQQLSRFRRDDHRAVKTAINHERWTRKVQAAEEAAAKAAVEEERRQNVLCYRLLRMGAIKSESIFFGKDDLGHDIAAMSLEEKHKLEFGMLGRKSDHFALPIDPDEPVFPWNRTQEHEDAHIAHRARKAAKAANLSAVAQSAKAEAAAAASEVPTSEGRPPSKAQSATEEVPRVPNFPPDPNPANPNPDAKSQTPDPKSSTDLRPLAAIPTLESKNDHPTDHDCLATPPSRKDDR